MCFPFPKGAKNKKKKRGSSKGKDKSKRFKQRISSLFKERMPSAPDNTGAPYQQQPGIPAWQSPPEIVGGYVLQRQLGRGSMGRVMLGVHQITGEKVAIKIVPRPDPHFMNMDPGPMDVDWGAYRIWKEQRAEAKREMRTIREAHIIKLVRHPHIVRFKGLTVSDSSIYISMEYVDGCELYQYILNRGRLSERRAVYFTRQIVSALDYLHRNSIVHRDLKIENIMVERKGRRIKLIDFGLSSLYSPERLMTTFCGSLYFAAPEVLRADAYRGPAVDVWSLGAVIYSMVVGETPFMDVSPYVTQERIKIADVDYPGYLSDNCRDLLRRIFVTDPKRRIILADIIRHPWLTGSRSDGPLRPIKNYVPLRKPLRMCQLKEVVLERMTEGFGLGTVQDVRRRIGIILSSDVYENAAQEVWQMQTSTSSSDTLSELPYDDPQSVPDAYHALVSLYHLIRERMVEDDDSGPKTSPTPRKLPVLSPKHILGCAMGMEECTKGEGLTAVLAVVRVAGYFNKKVKNII